MATEFSCCTFCTVFELPSLLFFHLLVAADERDDLPTSARQLAKLGTLSDPFQCVPSSLSVDVVCQVDSMKQFAAAVDFLSEIVNRCIMSLFQGRRRMGSRPSLAAVFVRLYFF